VVGRAVRTTAYVTEMAVWPLGAKARGKMATTKGEGLREAQVISWPKLTDLKRRQVNL
jgi:hypothetical protein